MGTLLLDEQTEDTSGSQSTLSINNNTNFAKYYTVVAYGTWDGATLTTKFSPDNGTTWIACGDETTFTTDGGANLFINPGSDMLIRGDITSAGASTSLSLKVF